MSEIQILETLLQKTAKRQRWQQAWRGAWQGLLVAATVWLIAVVSFKVLPIPEAILIVAGALSAVLIMAGFASGWWRRPTLVETARWVDAKKDLKERVSTALEVAKTPESGHWKELIVSDAAKSVTKVDPKQLLPYHLPMASQWALVVLILAVGLGFVPEYRTKAYVQKQNETEIMRETGRQLAELTRRSLEQRPPALEPTRQALDSVVELGDHLTKAQLTRSEALKDLASATDKLKEQAKELGKNPAFKTLERSARNSNKGGTPGPADLQKQIEAMEKALGNQAADSKAIEKLKNDLQKAKEAAAGLPDKESANGDAARDQLSQALSDLVQQAKDLGISLPSLDEAIAALAASQTDQVLKDLDIAETDLEKLQEMAKAMEQLQMQLEKAGKDLPDQLEKGQAGVAQNTLEKMVNQLRSGQVDAEKLKQILDEVTRSISPASPYGKAGEFLKQAAQQMNAGQNPGAAQSLAAAAKELENLMQQLEDAKAMMASLEALQRAQMAVGNCQRWGASKTPRAGKGGGVGAGVGTWADDSRWMDIGDIKDRWDNSGVVRPDEEARGVSDRGDAQLADNLAPTKVKGQITPGGPMPSITLKGVSIKGMSKVDFKEVATAAQSEAQSALSQEQVPRAYRGAVRDYFDDMKDK